MMARNLTVQGHSMLLTIEDNGDYFAPQWRASKTSSASFSDFTDMIGFKNTIAALKQIGREVLNMCEGLDKPVLFIGSTDKRTRVYAKLLKSCGFSFELVNEPVDGDLAIKIIF